MRWPRPRGADGAIRWPRPHWADVITLTGIVLTINEAMFRAGPERPGFQFMFLAMMGLSPVVRLDEKRTARKRAQAAENRDERTDTRTDNREERTEIRRDILDMRPPDDPPSPPSPPNRMRP